MSIKKCVNGSFANDVYKEYGTDTDTITSFPKQIIGDGQNISAYSIKGNMTQNEVCGDKTANLFDYQQTTGITDNCFINQSGQIVSNDDYYLSYPIYLETNSTYTWQFNTNLTTTHSAPTIGFYDNSNNLISAAQHAVSVKYFDFTTPNNCAYIRASVFKRNNTAQKYAMLNIGSTPSDFEPYGYKLPISLSQNTYNIYITEPLRKSLDGSNLYDTIDSNGTLTRRVDANGDALATPTTEQITVPTLPTTGTAETFDISTTLKPSEVSLTYHGWHEHSDTKF